MSDNNKRQRYMEMGKETLVTMLLEAERTGLKAAGQVVELEKHQERMNADLRDMKNEVREALKIAVAHRDTTNNDVYRERFNGKIVAYRQLLTMLDNLIPDNSYEPTEQTPCDCPGREKGCDLCPVPCDLCSSGCSCSQEEK